MPEIALPDRKVYNSENMPTQSRGKPMPTPVLDPFQFDDLLTPTQRKLRDQVREYMESAVKPDINDYWEQGEIALDSRARPARPPHCRRNTARLWLRRPRLPERRTCKVRDLPGRRLDQHPVRRPFRAGNWLDRDAGLAGTEAALAARNGAHGTAGRVRPDRARTGIRRGPRLDHRPSRRQSLRAQRRETLDSGTAQSRT